MNEIQEILYRLHQGVSQRHIEKSLAISRRAVGRVLKQAKALGFNNSISLKTLEDMCVQLVKTRRQKGGPRMAYKTLEARHDQVHKWHHMPHMTVTQMVKLFKEEGLIISQSSLHRYIKIHFPTPVISTVRLETQPAQQAQVDFAYVGMMKDARGNLRKAYAFLMILSHSRYRFVRFVFHQDIKSWVDCHKRAFHFFGGVPYTIVIDNLKAGVRLPDFYDPLSNKIYAELERHYGFVVDPAKVRMPRHKGKIERSVTLVRQQILAGRSFNDIEEANTYALEWCRHEIAMVITSTTGEKPYERYLAEEKHLLKPLPPEDYECPDWQSAKVHRDQHIVFQGSFYSVPVCYVGQTVWVRAGHRLLEIYADHTLIKSHVKADKKGQWITDKKDYPMEKSLFLDHDKSYCLKKSQEMGPYVFGLMDKIFVTESLTIQRKAQAILRLADTYSPDRLNTACQRALTFDNLTYKSLKTILSQNLDRQSLEPSTSVKQCLSKVVSYLRPLKEFSFFIKGSDL